LCTSDRSDLAEFLDACILGGVDVVQLRDKQLEARAVLERAAVAAAVCRDHDVPFILNDRPDMALAVGADGVHLGQDDVPPAVARQILGVDTIIGLSTHSPSDLVESKDELVDYISAGPVEPTPTKPGRAGTGLDYIRLVAESEPRPWFVTGGVTPDTLPAMLDAGACRFVVVRWLTEATDPGKAAQALRAVIDQAPHH